MVFDGLFGDWVYVDCIVWIYVDVCFMVIIGVVVDCDGFFGFFVEGVVGISFNVWCVFIMLIWYG